MKKKPYIGDVTYGMQYKEYSPILTKKIRQAKNCAGYKDFLEDVSILRKTRKNCGMPTIIANHWMKAICNMSKGEIREFVEKYKKGTLDPYQFEPKPREIENEKNEEEEDDFFLDL